ncbi:cation:proton antiporter subunit C [Candidatus Bipolaricaulota bacterium]|nr:cation:proton antiporter subunit C [Candidatus Bipolaricaulota bacterium]
MAAAVSFVLLGLGLVALVLRRDLVMKLLALGLINSSAILFLLSVGDRPGGSAPIQLPGETLIMVDPLPQALVLSAIVVNFAILALALVFVMILVERYHTTDSSRIEEELAHETPEEDEPCL